MEDLKLKMNTLLVFEDVEKKKYRRVM